MKREPITLFLSVLMCLGAEAYQSPPCNPCLDKVAEIRSELTEVGRRMNDPAAEPAPAWARDPEPQEPKPLFFQRLEAYDNYRASQRRLEAIESRLQKLEADLAVKEDPTLREMVETQKLIVAELRFQLDQIYRKFQELDRLIDAHEQRIDAIAGGNANADPRFAGIAQGIRAHLVASEGVSYSSIQEHPERKPLTVGDVWVFPRTELRYEDSQYVSTQVTAGVEGSLFGLVTGSAKGGLVFETRLTLELFVMAAGLEPVLSPTGAATRDAAAFCAVSKTFTYKGFGSVGVSGGLDVKVVKLSTGATVEAGQTFAGTSKRYSSFLQFRQGTTFEDKMAECRRFMRQVRSEDALDEELAGMFRVVQFPESTCYRDYDCRQDVQLGILKASVVSQCFPEKNRQYAVCRHRYVDVVQGCSLPNERVYNFRYHCAKGYTCEPSTRRCRKTVSDDQLLAQAGIAEAKVASLDAHYYDAVDGVLCGEGWKLPNVDQLPAVAGWFREFARANIRKTYPRATAQAWFYPRQAHTGLLWSDGQWAFLLSNDSVARYNPEDPQNAARFTDPATGKPVARGVAVCVRNQ